jgi:hypothetical protein
LGGTPIRQDLFQVPVRDRITRDERRQAGYRCWQSRVIVVDPRSAQWWHGHKWPRRVGKMPRAAGAQAHAGNTIVPRELGAKNPGWTSTSDHLHGLFAPGAMLVEYLWITR